MDFSNAMRLLRSGWWLLLLGALLGAAGGVALTVVSTPSYQATTRLYVAVQTGQSQSASELNQGSSAAQAKVLGYVPVVTSAPVLEPVVRELGLDRTPKALASDVSVSTPKGSQLLDVSVQGHDAAQVTRIANTIGTSIGAVVEDLEQPLADGSSPVKVTTLQPATQPTGPIDPRPSFNLALGTLLGLALAIAALFIRSMLDTRIWTASDVAAVADLPVLGAIGFNPDHETQSLFMRHAPRGALGEAIRDLRTNIAYLAGHAEMQTVMVTSAMQSEGKTTTSTNLAIAMADSDARVLLIDADLRRPRVAQVFDLEGAAGLSDVLVGRAEPSDVVQQWGDGGLHILPAGRIPPNPSELLGSQSMQVLMEEFGRTYDLIVVDAPPLLPVTDAAVLSKVCSGVIVAASARSGRKAHLRAALDRLEKIEARILGVVLTMLPARRGGDFSYGVYGGYYGDAPAVATGPVSVQGAARRRA